MSFKKLGFIYLSTILLLIGCNQSKHTEAATENINQDSYNLVNDWPNFPEGFDLGRPTGLGIDKENNLVVFHRAGRSNRQSPPSKEKIEKNTIITIDSETGEVLRNWGAGFFLMPHGLEIDRDNNIWITDTHLHQILKFNRDGELLNEFGEATIRGNDSVHFNKPTDVATAPDGSFYVSDGYGNNRVVKYSEGYSFLLEWGKNGPDLKLNEGTNEGEFDTPHAIDVDENMNVYVADRANNRIQKFDSDGNFITQWRNTSAYRVYSVAVDHKNNYLLATDYDTTTRASNIFRFDLELNLHMQFNNPNSMYHDIAIDDEGTVYVADIRFKKIQKFQLVKSESSKTKAQQTLK